MRKHTYVLLVLFYIPGFAYTQPPPNDSTPIPAAIKSVTKHSITINGKVINYTATAGALILKNEKDEQVALYGYTA